MPGFGSLLGAELLAATNGDLTTFNTADRLAGIAGLAPVPRDSGRISGNLKRPRRYDRRLLRVFYLAANNSIKTCPRITKRITTASGLRANDTPRPSSASHAGASTSSGPCSATTPATNLDYLEPLDNLIETHSDEKCWDSEQLGEHRRRDWDSAHGKSCSLTDHPVHGVLTMREI